MNGLPSTGDSVLDGLAALVDTSLVRPITEPGATPRFTMLETIGEYAREQLAVSADEWLYRRRHALAFLTVAEQLAIMLRSAERMAWHDLLVAESDNLRAAVKWAIATGDRPEPAAGGCPLLALAPLGQFHDGRHWSETALARSQDATDQWRGPGRCWRRGRSPGI